MWILRVYTVFKTSKLSRITHENRVLSQTGVQSPVRPNHLWIRPWAIVGHFVSSPRESGKIDGRVFSRGKRETEKQKCLNRKYRGADSEGFVGFDRSPFDWKFHFPGKFWIHLINLEYRIYPKYSHPCSLYVPYTSLQQLHFTTYECV